MLASASLLTAFVAGVVALFAPCCIGFLLPSYLGTVFQERRRVFMLTGVFALGIFTIFLPIGLGIGMIGAFLLRFHSAFFYAGAAVLGALGVMLVLGYVPMLHIASPRMRKMSIGGIYGLGVVSGIASACCAPVFAGVAALSVLAASPLGGAVLAGAYVLGMVVPLFILSWFIDRTDVLERFTALQKQLPWRLGPIHGETTVGYVIAGTIFSVAGLFIFWTTKAGFSMDDITWLDSIQFGLLDKLEKFAPWLGGVSEWVWLGVLAAAVLLIIVIAKRSGSRDDEDTGIKGEGSEPKKESEDKPEDGHKCH